MDYSVLIVRKEMEEKNHYMSERENKSKYNEKGREKMTTLYIRCLSSASMEVEKEKGKED